jgi:enoyl-[acyl-carrier protein] reductase I
MRRIHGRADDGQTRPDHGRRQRPVHRLGHRQGDARRGAELAFTYQGEAFGKRVEPLAASVGSDLMVDVDVTDDASLDAAFAAAEGALGQTLDFLVHAIAYSDKAS